MPLSVLLQYALPHRFLSRLVYSGTRWTWKPWKNFLIGRVVASYDVDMAQAEQPDPFAFASFNAFFTRALKVGARSAPADARAIACPADGRISQLGAIRGGRIFQAKGQDFSVAELLADETEAAKYTNGLFATVYLSPRDTIACMRHWPARCAKRCTSPDACSAWLRGQCNTCRACSRAMSAWSAISRARKVRSR